MQMALQITTKTFSCFYSFANEPIRDLSRSGTTFLTGASPIWMKNWRGSTVSPVRAAVSKNFLARQEGDPLWPYTQWK